MKINWLAHATFAIIDFDEFQIYSPRADGFTNAWIDK
jgi:hypothetical protein